MQTKKEAFKLEGNVRGREADCGSAAMDGSKRYYGGYNSGNILEFEIRIGGMRDRCTGRRWAGMRSEEQLQLARVLDSRTSVPPHAGTLTQALTQALHCQLPLLALVCCNLFAESTLRNRPSLDPRCHHALNAHQKVSADHE